MKLQGANETPNRKQVSRCYCHLQSLDVLGQVTVTLHCGQTLVSWREFLPRAGFSWRKLPEQGTLKPRGDEAISAARLNQLLLPWEAAITVNTDHVASE